MAETKDVKPKKKSRTRLIIIILVVLLLLSAATAVYLWITKDDEEEGNKLEDARTQPPFQSQPKVVAPQEVTKPFFTPGITGRPVPAPRPPFQSIPRPVAPGVNGATYGPRVPTAESRT